MANRSGKATYFKAAPSAWMEILGMSYERCLKLGNRNIFIHMREIVADPMCSPASHRVKYGRTQKFKLQPSNSREMPIFKVPKEGVTNRKWSTLDFTGENCGC